MEQGNNDLPLEVEVSVDPAVDVPATDSTFLAFYRSTLDHRVTERLQGAATAANGAAQLTDPRVGIPITGIQTMGSLAVSGYSFFCAIKCPEKRFKHLFQGGTHLTQASITAAEFALLSIIYFNNETCDASLSSYSESLCPSVNYLLLIYLIPLFSSWALAEFKKQKPTPATQTTTTSIASEQPEKKESIFHRVTSWFGRANINQGEVKIDVENENKRQRCVVM